MNKFILECKNLHKNYKNNIFNKKKVLNNINFQVKKGEIVSIIGESGSGKSTLLHILGGLDNPSSGEIIFNSKKLNTLNNKEKSKILNCDLGFIYQFHHLLNDFTILENLSIPLLISKKKKKIAEKKAINMVEAIGLKEIMHFKPSEISGGERQRVAVARALINNPKLVLADEPTGNLDKKNSNLIFNLISKYNKLNKTAFLIVTHDLSLSKKIDRQMKMENGNLYDI